MAARPDIAYLFARYPDPSKTFCIREIEGLRQEGRWPLVFSLWNGAPQRLHLPFGPEQEVIHVPRKSKIKRAVRGWQRAADLSPPIMRLLRRWRREPDGRRLYEAAFIGMEMKRRRVTHVHGHFLRTPARTCYWIKQISHTA